MNTHHIPPEWFEAAGLELDPRLCILEAAPGDGWRGFMVGPAAWQHGGFRLQLLPRTTARDAFAEYAAAMRA